MSHINPVFTLCSAFFALFVANSRKVSHINLVAARA